MLSRHDKYPIPCARVHGAMGAGNLSLRASATCFAHQSEQRAAAEFSLFDLVRDPSAVSCAVRITSIRPLCSLPPEPVGTGETVRRASIDDRGQPMAWINALGGWARRGERRHLANVAGAVLLLTLGATLAAGV